MQFVSFCAPADNDFFNWMRAGAAEITTSQTA